MLLIIKSLHIIAVISWFAGLLYLPRLFVYHADCADTAGRERFVVMEKRLYWYIMLPAMLATLLLGLTLVGYGISGGWIAVKLMLVFCLLVFHISLLFFMKKLSSGRHPGARFFRWYNEIPTLLLIGIVFLTVLKPF